MNRKLIAILVANVFAAGGAVAAEPGLDLSGAVSLGVRGVRVDAQDKAKFNEYRDLKDNGAIGSFVFNAANPNYYINGFGENLGYDDQYISINGGQYGMFKYQVFQNDIIHNNTFGALTPYNGLGSNVLRGPTQGSNAPGALPPSAWNTFEFKNKRETFGGNFEISLNSPWFIRFDAFENKQQGLKPEDVGVNGITEVPEPINWKTNNLSVEGGYTARNFQITASALKSKFTNANDVLYFADPSMVAGNPGLNTVTLPPDNELTKYAVQGVWRRLPFGSSVAGRYTRSEATNSIGIGGVPGLASMLTTVAGAPVYTGTVSPGTFDGKIITQTAGFSVTSQWTRQFDTKVFYNWAKKENESTQPNYRTGAALTPWVDVYNRFGTWKKNNFGLDASYRLNPGNKFIAGYDYLKMETNREDVPTTKENKYTLEYKNTMVQALSARLKYQRLDRDGEKEVLGTPVPASTSAALLDRYFTRFDVAKLDQDLLKAVLDWTPVTHLDLGFEAIYKKNKYKDNTLGRTEEQRNEYIVNAAWGDPSVFRVNAFADWEEGQIKTGSRFIPRTFAGFNTTQNFDPNTPLFVPTAGPGAGFIAGVLPTATTQGNCFSVCSYNWNDANKDKTFTFGLGADWHANERWLLNASYIYMKTTGTVDFSSAGNIGTPSFIPNSNVSHFDNTKKNSFNAKATYKVNRNWSITGGGAYEKYTFQDDAYSGYVYNPITTSSAITATNRGAYLTGVNAFPAYTAKIYYLLGTYSF